MHYGLAALIANVAVEHDNSTITLLTHPDTGGQRVPKFYRPVKMRTLAAVDGTGPRKDVGQQARNQAGGPQTVTNHPFGTALHGVGGIHVSRIEVSGNLTKQGHIVLRQRALQFRGLSSLDVVEDPVLDEFVGHEFLAGDWPGDGASRI